MVRDAELVNKQPWTVDGFNASRLARCLKAEFARFESPRR
jgi:hypothetical protein